MTGFGAGQAPVPPTPAEPAEPAPPAAPPRHEAAEQWRTTAQIAHQTPRPAADEAALVPATGPGHPSPGGPPLATGAGLPPPAGAAPRPDTDTGHAEATGLAPATRLPSTTGAALRPDTGTRHAEATGLASATRGALPIAAPAVLRAGSAGPAATAPAANLPADPRPAAITPPTTAPTLPPVTPPPPPQHPPHRITRRLVLPLVAGELVLVLLLLVLDRTWPTILTVACCGVILAAFATVRVRRRLLCQWVLLACRFLLRDRAADLPADDPGTALLALLRPDASCSHTMIGDAQAYVVNDVDGIGTVLRPESSRRDAGPPPLSPRDLLPGSDEQALAYAVQLVHHAGVDRTQPPRVWLTLRALRTAEVFADDDVHAALANVVRRVRRRLRRAGTPFRPLTEQETLGSYAALAHVNAGRGRVREDWWHWHSGPIRHATFRLDGWAGLSQQAAARLVRWLLAAAPDSAVTVSHTAHHRPTDPSGPPVSTAVLRLASSRPDALAAAVTDVARLATEVGVTLNRLDGQHVRGVAATLPVGVVGVR